MIWVEIDGEQIEVIDMAEAKRIIMDRFPNVKFMKPHKLDGQRITHARRVSPVPSDLDLIPVAVIVEDELAL